MTYGETNVLSLFLFLCLIGVMWYNAPTEGDVKHFSGQPWEYRCNWAGCGWAPIIQGKVK